MKYVYEHVRFSSEIIDENLKIIKIKGGFSCNDDEAREILKKIEAKENIVIEGYHHKNLIGFGINCYTIISEEGFKNREKEKLEEEKKEQQFEIDKTLAEMWFNSLNETEQNYVKILSWTKFYTAAQG